MSLRIVLTLCLGAVAAAGPARAEPTLPVAQPAGHITGIGGVFIKARDPKALAAWYRDMLGLPLQPWGGAALRYDAAGHPPAAAWAAFPASSAYFAPSASAVMIDYAVDDLDAIVKRLQDHEVAILKRSDDENGRFAWLLDPEGNKVELWEPKRAPAP